MGDSHRISDYREVELNCCTIPLTAAGGGSVFAVTSRGSRQSGFRSARRRGRRSPRRWSGWSCTSFRLVPGSIHRDCFRPPGSAGCCLRSSGGVYPVLTRWTATSHTLAGLLAAWCERYSGIEEGCVLSNPGSAEEAHKVKSPSRKGTGWEEGSKASATTRDRGPTSHASVPSRIPDNSAVSYGRFRRQTGRPPSQWSCSHPDPSWSRPCDARNSHRFAQDKWPSVTLLGAGAEASRIRTAVKPGCVVPPKGDVPPRQTSNLPKFLRNWQQFWTSPETRPHSRRNSKRVRMWRLPKWSTRKFSTAANQEGEGFRDWAVLPKCSAFHAPVTSTLE